MSRTGEFIEVENKFVARERKECGVTATFDASRTTFTREGSFRVTTATEQAEREEIMKQIQDAKKGTICPTTMCVYLKQLFPTG